MATLTVALPVELRAACVRVLVIIAVCGIEPVVSRCTDRGPD